MSIAQFIVAYAVCWWLVLFMLLPVGAQPVSNPVPGHAPSAPANPRLKRKFGWATLLALLPTALIYVVATQARAEETAQGQETIYHVGSKGCHTLEKHVPAADLNVQDGYGAGGKRVKHANIEGENNSFPVGDVDIPLRIPSDNYMTPPSPGTNVDMSESFIHAGTLTVKQNGDALLNGKSIADSWVYTGDCNEKK